MSQKGGDCMNKSLNVQHFSFEYIESKIDHPILWESHCHAQYEMIAVAAGDITVMLEGQKYRLQKNQIIIIPPLFIIPLQQTKKESIVELRRCSAPTLFRAFCAIIFQSRKEVQLLIPPT